MEKWGEREREREKERLVPSVFFCLSMSLSISLCPFRGSEVLGDREREREPQRERQRER